MSWKRIVIVLCVLFLGIYLFFLVFPLLLVGSPTSVYFVGNEDDNTHNLTVEIFDEQNVSVLKETYVLDANESIFYNREVRWYFPFPSSFVTWSDGLFTFSFTVDNSVTNQITREINQYVTVAVDIEPSENDTISIDICIYCV
jgi:hypothetical protein